MTNNADAYRIAADALTDKGYGLAEKFLRELADIDHIPPEVGAAWDAAVVKNPGWYPWKDVLPESKRFYASVAEELLNSRRTVPRVWDDLDDVPTNVAVTDCDGDRNVFRDGSWRWLGSTGNWYEAAGGLAPYTEILEG
ncbi:hypothetical protein ACFU44_00620 [Nocardia rhizosphaerihabitans]|uniref:hypothetical protein n=1 Tax=Nocardia rhizosphaerihabitans TaxID=1691570 RepID=UPI00366B7565